MGIVKLSKFKYMIPIHDDYVGIVYGKKGSNLKKISEKYNTIIKFRRATTICRYPEFIVSGTNELSIWNTINHIQYIVSIAKKRPKTKTQHKVQVKVTPPINNVEKKYSTKPTYNPNWLEFYYMGCTCHSTCSCNFGGCCDDSWTDPCINCDVKDIHDKMMVSANEDYIKWYNDMEIEYKKYLDSGNRTRLEYKPFIVIDHKYPMRLAEKELGVYCHCSACRKIRKLYPTYKNTSFFHG